MSLFQIQIPLQEAKASLQPHCSLFFYLNMGQCLPVSCMLPCVSWLKGLSLARRQPCIFAVLQCLQEQLSSVISGHLLKVAPRTVPLIINTAHIWDESSRFLSPKIQIIVSALFQSVPFFLPFLLTFLLLHQNQIIYVQPAAVSVY